MPAAASRGRAVLLRAQQSNLIFWVMLSWPQLRSSLLCCLHLLHLHLCRVLLGQHGAESQRSSQDCCQVGPSSATV